MSKAKKIEDSDTESDSSESDTEKSVAKSKNTEKTSTLKKVGLAAGLGILAVGLGLWARKEKSQFDRLQEQNSRKCLNDFVDDNELDAENGDLIEFKKDGYSHWGVYVAKNSIIHFVNLKNGSGKVVNDTLKTVAESRKCRVNNLEEAASSRNLDRKPYREICSNAFEFEGETFSYSWSDRNCEHFATQCAFGEAFSEQANNTKGKPFVVLAVNTASLSMQLHKKITQ